MSMGNLLSMSVYIFVTCRCMFSCVDMYMCMNILSCMFICAHIAFACTL